MKYALFALSVLSSAALAQSPSPTPTPWPISAIKTIAPAGVIVSGDYNAGNVAAFLRDRPEFTEKIYAILAAQLESADELTANRRIETLVDAGVTLPKVTTDKHAARVLKFAKQKETALMKVKDTDQARAKAKLDEFLAAKIPIAQNVQDAVNKAAAPAGAPMPTPSPTPNDGL